MARNSFGRTVVETHCEVKYIDENNDVQREKVVLFGNYTLESAQNAARKAMKNNRVLVEKVSHKSYYGVISMEKFAENCDSITNVKEW